VIPVALCARARGRTRPFSSFPGEEDGMRIHDFAGMTVEESEALARVLEAYELQGDAFEWGYEMPTPLRQEPRAAYATS
jgi:hypothetical protein